MAEKLLLVGISVKHFIFLSQLFWHQYTSTFLVKM